MSTSIRPAVGLTPPARHSMDLGRLNDHFLLVVLLLFSLADLPAVLGLTGQDNRLFVAIVPYLLVLAMGYVVLRPSIPAEPLFVWTIGIAAALYVLSFFSPTLQHPVAQSYIRDWVVQKTGFIVTLLLLFVAYGFVRANPPERNRAIVDLFVRLTVAVIIGSFLIYLLASFVPFLPERVLAYGEGGATVFGRTWSRFGATMKEPSEFAFLCTFLVAYLVTKRRYAQAAVVGSISLFSLSNFLSVGYLFVLSSAVAVAIAPRLVVPGLLAAFAAAGVAFYLLGPHAGLFSFLETITPRSYSLLSFRPDTPQRLWGNVIAVREFTEFGWPLGGGAGFLRAYTRDFYFYTVYRSYAPGTGVFRFLMDFGIFAIPLLLVLCRRLHRGVALALPGQHHGIKALVLLCVFYLSVRTGYLNISVWTLIFMLYYGYLRTSRSDASNASSAMAPVARAT